MRGDIKWRKKHSKIMRSGLEVAEAKGIEFIEFLIMAQAAIFLMVTALFFSDQVVTTLLNLLAFIGLL